MKAAPAVNAGGLNGEELQEATGLVAGHEYSILDAVELGDSLLPGFGERVRLGQLRNPWGKYEDKGAWSDDSAEWKAHPHVARKLGHVHDKNDGIFWMPLEAFMGQFHEIGVCDRTTDGDLHLHAKEDYGCAGVAWGFIKGSVVFWLGCRSCRVLYCGHVSTGDTRSAERGMFGRI